MLCMKYCSVSNYFTRVRGRGGSACRPPPGGEYRGGNILSFSFSFSLLLFLLVTFLFLLSFSFSLSLFASGVIRKLFGLHCFPFNIVGFAYLQCICLFHKYRFRTFRLRKIALWGANQDFRLNSFSHLANFQILGYNHTCKCAKHALAGRQPFMTYKLAEFRTVGVMVGFRLAGQTGKAVGYDRYTLAGSGLHIGCRSRTPSRKIP